jgi:CspA family cold shock protein
LLLRSQAATGYRVTTATAQQPIDSFRGATQVQGVIKSYDPATGDGSLLCDSNLSEYELGPNALEGSIFRMLRQGQRVCFDLDKNGLATGLHLGSEIDMGTPDFAGHAEPTPELP